MRKVSVLLKETVENLGNKGEVVQISEGYAKNYIVRKGMGVFLDDKSKKNYEERIAIERKKMEKSERRSLELKADLENKVKLVFVERAGQEGKLFGAITSDRILEELNKVYPIVGLDRKKILIEEPIKTLGLHHVSIKLFHGVLAQVSVEVEELKE